MAGRPSGVAGIEKIEFFKRFDALAKQHIDPLELMFKIAKGDAKEIGRGWEKQHRLIAARELIGYRFPKLRAIETKLDTGDAQIEISWLSDDDSADSLPTPCVSIRNTQEPKQVQGDRLS